MFSSVLSFGIHGIDGFLVKVEADISDGMPMLELVGYLSAEVREARERSGTMITADMALDQGRDVAILPGRVSDPLSMGCLNLWKQGAYPVTCAEDIMYIIDAAFDNKKKKKVYDSLEPYAKSIGQISDELKMEVRDVISALVELAIKGLAQETGKGCYVRIKDWLAVSIKEA